MNISIIIPTFNNYKKLMQCVESIYISYHLYLNKKPKYIFELIVIDDGSLDSTAKISKDYPKLKYFRIENSGPGAARNFGASKSRGDVLVFIEDDFILPKDFFPRISDYIRLHDLISFKVLYPGKNIYSQAYQSIYDSHIYKNLYITDPKESDLNMFKRYLNFMLVKKEKLFNSQIYRKNISLPLSCLLISKKLFWKSMGFKKYRLLSDLDFIENISKKHKILFVQDIMIIHNSYSNSKDFLNSIKNKIDAELLRYGNINILKFTRLMFGKSYDFINWIKFSKKRYLIPLTLLFLYILIINYGKIIGYFIKHKFLR